MADACSSRRRQGVVWGFPFRSYSTSARGWRARADLPRRQAQGHGGRWHSGYEPQRLSPGVSQVGVHLGR
eukprot:8258433-Lingulodinium_polyedra.AAC.1